MRLIGVRELPLVVCTLLQIGILRAGFPNKRDKSRNLHIFESIYPIGQKEEGKTDCICQSTLYFGFSKFVVYCQSSVLALFVVKTNKYKPLFGSTIPIYQYFSQINHYFLPHGISRCRN